MAPLRPQADHWNLQIWAPRHVPLTSQFGGQPDSLRLEGELSPVSRNRGGPGAGKEGQ